MVIGKALSTLARTFFGFLVPRNVIHLLFVLAKHNRHHTWNDH